MKNRKIKKVPICGCISRGYKETMKKGKYGGNILYSCRIIEQLTC
jgi:hypothetical protein